MSATSGKTRRRVRVPQITDLKTAIELYLKKSELTSNDILTLFGGNICKDTVMKLKNVARDKMEENHVRVWNTSCVNTAAAYEAWGLDIDDLKHRLQELRALGLE